MHQLSTGIAKIKLSTRPSLPALSNALHFLSALESIPLAFWCGDGREIQVDNLGVIPCIPKPLVCSQGKRSSVRIRMCCGLMTSF